LKHANLSHMTDPSLTELNRWLVQLVERRGSDLLLVTDAPACVRVDGQVVPIGTQKLMSDEIENAITPALMPHALRQYLEIRIADSSYRTPTLAASELISIRSADAPPLPSAHCLLLCRFCMSCIFRRQLNSLPTSRADWS
jgi:hypothetical protein